MVVLSESGEERPQEPRSHWRREKAQRRQAGPVQRGSQLAALPRAQLHPHRKRKGCWKMPRLTALCHAGQKSDERTTVQIRIQGRENNNG
jgi:hypothetical protein